MKKRLDTLIFEKGLTESREKAQRLIMAGQVLVEGKRVDKPGSKFEEKIKIEILKKAKYVSRGGEKIAKAAKVFKINFQNKIVADIGASTGGFTDFALQKGAKKVYAIDVGRGQLDWRLRNNPKVVVMEKVNARNLKSLPDAIDIFLIDVSFISVKKILPAVKRIKNHELRIKKKENMLDSKFLLHDSDIIVLFKPQFEAGKEVVSKTKGVIKDPKIHQELLEDFRRWCQENGFKILGETVSPILGDKGNKEFFFYLEIKNSNF